MTDGVSVMVRNWQRAMTDIGFEVITVAGEGPVDRTVPALAITAEEQSHGRTVSQLEEALADADLVVVENLLSIPLNMAASRATHAVLAGRPAIIHHHDPPWQRQRFAHITELPARDPAWRHVTINRLTVKEMAERGIEATCIYNGFPIDTGDGEGKHIRDELGVADNERLLAHPVRAIERKNLPAAIDLAEQTDSTYWLWGGAEDGYDDELARIIRGAKCRVINSAPAASAADLYSAADAVIFPSLWEGFGNPPVEAAIHRIPAAVGRYPVADELRELGFRWLPTDDASPLRQLLADTDSLDVAAMLDNNRHVVASHLSLDRMEQAIRCLLEGAGWMPSIFTPSRADRPRNNES